jgi:hypothetical protein
MNIARHGFRMLNLVAAPLVERGLGNPLPVGVGPVVVETEGRKSGKARRVPLLSSRIGSTVFVSTVRPDSQWMKNLSAQPAAAVRLFGNDYPATAKVRRLGPLQVATLVMHD